MLWLCEEYEGSSNNECTTDADNGGDDSPKSVDDDNDAEDDILVQELDKSELDEALQKNAEVWCYWHF